MSAGTWGAARPPDYPFESATTVTLRGLPEDEDLLRQAHEQGDRLAAQTSSPCHVGFQTVRRLGSDPVVEVIVSVTVHGAPVWAIASDGDWSRAFQTAFARVAERARLALDWGDAMDLAWRYQEI